MGQPSSKDEMTVRHQFDRLCQMALKGEAVNYYKHMDYRRKHEVTFSELSEKELSKLFTMDEYGTENHHFEVHGYDIEVKNTLIAEALKELTERKRNVILLSYFMEMSDADIARDLFASDNGSLLFNRLQKALQETLLKELVSRDIKMNVPSEQYPLISSFVAGGMVSAYYEWITDPDGITLDEMARTLTTLIISGVHAFA